MKFRNGDVVMVCKHLYEQSSCRVVQQSLSGAVISRRNIPRRPFIREDGTKGEYDFAALCKECSRLPRNQVDTIEQHYRAGRLLVADFAE